MRYDERNLEDLARRIEAACPSLGPEGRRIALAVFREMGSGDPAPVEAIAERAGAESRSVRDALESWPGVYRDEAGRVVGFWGLALDGMPHPIRVGDRTLYAWCAWDALFLGELLGDEIQVESSCAATGRAVSMTVGARGVTDLVPETAVISFLDPERADVERNRVISSFCHHILFFSSPEAWEGWERQRRQETFPMSVEEAWRLGRLANRLRYGEELTS